MNLLPNGGYELHHDFAFPNRDRGEDIKEMTVSLTWDESWVQEDEVKEGGGAQVGVGGKAEDRQAIFTSSSTIPPKSGFVVRQRLNYIGDKNDLAPYYEDFADYRIGLYLGIIIFLAMTQVWIYRRAVQKGILEKPKLYTTWDEVNNTIGNLLPEEVCLIAEHKGKLIETWITRLMNENKLHAGICPDTGVFKLKKLVPDSEFSEEDQKILKGLFVAGGSEITGEDIKAHYTEKKVSYSLYLDIFRRYEGLVKNFIEKFKPTNESFWSDIVSIFDYSPYLFLLMYIMFMFFWDGWESIIPKGAGYSKAEFLRDFVIFLFISIGSAIAAHSGLKEKHFGFEDLKSNRKKLFFKSFIGSILLLTIMFILLFWNRFYSYQFYTVFMVLLGIRAFFFLWLASPKYAMNQIRFILDMISSTNFIRSRFQSDDPCDVPIGLSSYLPALELIPDLEARIQSGKNDCLYLFPYGIQKLINSGEINSGFIHTRTSRISSSSTTGFSSLSSGAGLAGSSFQGGGGSFGGAGGSASWGDSLQDFASSASYSPPGGGGSGSSGGGGGGGW